MPRFRYLLLLALAAYLLTGLTQVRPGERAVVRRFGQVVARPEAGLWVGWPWGIDRVDRVPVRSVRQLKAGIDPETAFDAPRIPVGQFLTGDQNLVNVQLILDYAIGETDVDLDDFVMHQDKVDVALARQSEAIAGEWLGGRGVDEALLTGAAALPPWIMERLPTRIAALKLGIRVQRINASLAPPKEVRAAFEQVSQAQTGIRTKEYQARQEAEQRLRQAESLRYKYEQEAEVFKLGQQRQASADAAEFLAQLSAYRELKKSNPAALSVLWWNEMQKTLLGMRSRGGRVEPLDNHLGPNGLDISQVVSPKRSQIPENLLKRTVP
ncbi:MAG TPA: SPFH domain-containing protein [Gemmataceae bacterium]|jgi:membrane protease subunit HflK